MLKAEVEDTLLLYGHIMWSSNKADCHGLRLVHHSMLVRCLGWRKRDCEDHTLFYADPLVKTDFESAEVKVRRRRTLFAGFVVCTGEERLPKRAVCVGSWLEGRATSGDRIRG